MTWDFAEINPTSDSVGNFMNHVEWVAASVAAAPTTPQGYAVSLDAAGMQAEGCVLSTDPPYYDNIGYADLSDFFYVWLRRSLRQNYPSLFSTVLVPKSHELVATPYRFGRSKHKAQEFFEQGLGKAFGRMHDAALPGYPLAIYYAFKQTESEGELEAGSIALSTGWETMLSGLLHAGLTITNLARTFLTSACSIRGRIAPLGTAPAM